MAEYGAKLTADASGFVAGVGESTKAQAKLNEELTKGGGAAKSASAEAKAFVDRIKEMSETLGKTRAETERYRASQLDLTTAQRSSVDASLKSIEAHDKNAAAMTTLRTTALAAGLAIGAFAVSTGVAVAGTIQQRAELYHLSESLGVAVPALSTMQYQLQLAGVNSEAFGLSMRGLVKNISEAQRGVGDGAQLFSLLGDEIYAAASRGASLEELLPLMAEAFAHFADGPNKSALAIQLFGRTGEQMIPLLNRGAAGFKAAADEAKHLGVVTGDLTAYQAAKLEEELVRLDANLGAMKRRLASDIVPALLEVAERFNKAAASGQGLAGVIGVLAGQGGGAMAEQMGAGGLALNFAPPPAALAALTAEQRGAVIRSFRLSEMLSQTKAAPVQAGEFEQMSAQLTAVNQLLQHQLTSSQALTQSEQALIQLQAQEAAGLMNNLSPAKRQELKDRYAANIALEKEIAERQRAIELARIQGAGEDAMRASRQAEYDSINNQRRAYSDQNAQLQLDIDLTNQDAERQKALATATTDRYQRIQIETRYRVEANIALERAVALRKLELDYLQQLRSLPDDPLISTVEAINAAYAKQQRQLNILFDGKTAATASHDAAAASAKEWQAQFDRTSDNIERTLSQALVTGFMQGGKSGAEVLKRALESTFATLVLEPLLKPILMPVAQFGAGLSQYIFGGAGQAAGGAGYSSLFGSAAAGAGGSAANAGMLGAGGLSQYFSNPWAVDAMYSQPGTAIYGSGGMAASGAASYAGWYGALFMLANSTAGTRAREKVLGARGTDFMDPIGALYRGKNPQYVIGQQLDPFDIFGIQGPMGGNAGDAMRTAQYRGGFGQAGAIVNDQWFSGSEMNPSLNAFSAAQAAAEQNLISNLHLSPEQVSAVNAALGPLGGRTYQFGMEHSDVNQSGAFGQIQADRLQAISSVLGRTIQDLTDVMSVSAAQWQAQIDSLQQAYDTGAAQLGQVAQGLADKLGITSLQSFQDALAIAPDQSPLDRISAAQSQYEALLARVKGGDLSAVSALTQSGSSYLGIERDVFASGPEFQAVRAAVGSGIQTVLDARTQDLREIQGSTTVAVLQSGADTVQALKSGFMSMASKLDEVRQELFRMRGT